MLTQKETRYNHICKYEREKLLQKLFYRLALFAIEFVLNEHDLH